MGIVLTFSPSFPSPLVKQSLLAAASSVAFLGRTELFTAHATLAVLPVLDKRSSGRELGRLWFVLYVGNLVGCALFAGLISLLGPELGIVTPAAFDSLVGALLQHTGWVITLSGVVAGLNYGHIALVGEDVDVEEDAA